jgi:plasmid stabilization system protein ParE
VSRFELARRALGDLQDIWEHISEDSFDAADRVLEDFYRAFGQLAEMPRIGTDARTLQPETFFFGLFIHTSSSTGPQTRCVSSE